MDRLDRQLLLGPVGHVRDRVYLMKFVKFFAISILAGLIVSLVFGETFDYKQQVKFKGQATSLSRNVRSTSSSSQLKDPFPDRPRIRTHNGHLVIEASQDKSIEFRTSGLQGSVSINGLKLDKLLNVTRALERTAISGQSLSGTQDDGAQLEIALRGFFTAEQRLKVLELNMTNLIENVNNLLTTVKKLSRKSSKRDKQLQKLAEVQEAMMVKLKKNDCLNGETGASVCMNGAQCVDLYDDFECLCPPQWEGKTCDQDVNECSMFRSTELGCQNGARCVNLPGSYRCECTANFHGIHCTEQHDDCALSSSRSLCGHGKCIDLVRTTPNQARYECICDQGWTTDNSMSPACTIDIDECNNNNNSTSNFQYPCSLQPFVQCTNLPGSFQCGSCPSGYQGNGRICTDVDECLIDNGGCSTSPLVECINLIGSRRCGRCPPGYSGDGINCIPLTACSTSTITGQLNGGCHPMAKCIPMQGFATTDWQSRVCDCQYPYIGSGIGPMGCQLISANPPNSLAGPSLMNNVSDVVRAASDSAGLLNPGNSWAPIDPCMPNPLPPCQNGGLCRVDSYGEIDCLCPLGWSGPTCAEPLARCSGQYNTPTGQLQFPPADLKELAKISPKTSNLQQQQQQLLYDCLWTISLTNAKQQTSSASSTNVNNLNLYFSGIQNRLNPSKRVELYMANSTSFNINSITNCLEYLDIYEIITSNEVVANTTSSSDSMANQQQQSQAAKAFASSSITVSNERAADLLAWLNATRNIQAAYDTLNNGKHLILAKKRRLLARICTELSATGPSPLLRHKTLENKASLQFQVETGEAELEYKFELSTRTTMAASEPKLAFQLKWNASEPGCGGDIEVTESGSISSPKFPEFYRAGIECRWILRAQQGKRLRLHIGELSLLSVRESLDKACSDSLTILDGKFGLQRPVLFRQCGNNLTNVDSNNNNNGATRSIVSSSSSVEILLDSSPDSDWPVGLRNVRQKRGFIITYASELDTPGCGGIYTARSGTVISSDYEPNLPLDYLMPTNDNNNGNYNKTMRARLIKDLFSSSRFGMDSIQAKLSTMRCEYELRPANQLRYQRVAIDKIDMPSILQNSFIMQNSAENSLMRRRFACIRAKLTIYDVNNNNNNHNKNYVSGNDNQTSSSNRMSSLNNVGQNVIDANGFAANALKSSGEPVELVKFCPGDNYDIRQLDQANQVANQEHIVSSGHSLMVVYESIWWDNKPIVVSADNTDNKQQVVAIPAGFRLRYSTICTATFENLLDQMEMELGPDNAYCLYHIVLPANNSISVIVQPQLTFNSGPEASSLMNTQNGWLDKNQQCQYEAFLIDGPLENGEKSLHQLDRKIAQFIAASNNNNHYGSKQNAVREGGAISSRVVAVSSSDLDVEPDETTQQQQQSTTEASILMTNAIESDSTDFKRDSELDVKQFNPCVANTFESIWNHASLLIRRKANVQILNNLQANAIASIKYQAEPSCGGILTSSKSGSFKLISSNRVQSLQRPPLTATRYSVLYERQFHIKCAWIIKAMPGQLVQISFKAPDEAIQARIKDWQSWAKQQLAISSTSNKTSSATNATNSGVKIINEGNLLDNCREIFPEFVELYEPTLNRSRLLCLIELLPSNSTLWTSMSNTVYVRLLNYTTSASYKSSWPAFKPFLGDSADKQLIVQYNKLARNESKSFGGIMLFDSGVIRSPQFPYNYPPSLDINWVIQVKIGQQIRLNFSLFNLEQHGECIFDYLELRGGFERDSPLIGRFCGNQLQSRILISQTNLLRLRFVTDRHTNKRGFEIFYDVASSGCGGELSSSSGQIDSPYYPQPYSHSARCEWSIEVNSANRIEVTLIDLQLGDNNNNNSNSSSCYVASNEQDQMRATYLELFDSNSWNGPAIRSLGRWCQLKKLRQNERKFVTKGNKLSIVYESQALDQSPGFRLSYRTVCSNIELTSLSGSIESPGFPRAYAPNITCNWLLSAPMGSKLRLALTHVDIEHPSLVELITRPSIITSTQLKPTAKLANNTNASDNNKPDVIYNMAACSDDELAIWALKPTDQFMNQTDEIKFVDAIQKYKTLRNVLQARHQNNPGSFVDTYGNGIVKRVPQNGTLLASICGQKSSLLVPSQGVNNSDLFTSSTNENNELIYELNTNRAYITFQSDSSIQQAGFRLEWQVLGCGGEITINDESSSEKIIHRERKLQQTSANRSSAYECFWTIRTSVSAANVGPQIDLLVFSDMHKIVAENSDNSVDFCKESSLTIYDGSTMKSPILLQNCDSKRTPQFLYSSGDSVLVRFYSSGKHYSGHEFQIMIHPGSGNKCIRQELDPTKAKRDKREFNVFERSLSWPPISLNQNQNNNADQFVSCTDFHINANYARAMFRIEDLNIPYEPNNASASSSVDLQQPTSGLISSKLCKNSKNYLLIGRGDSRDQYLCGKISRQDQDQSLISLNDDLTMQQQTVFVLDRSYALVNFKARASLGASWKLSVGQLCGSTTAVRSVRDFSTPNYPSKPQWARPEGAQGVDLSENVCLWKFEPDSKKPANSDNSNSTGDNALDKRIYFQLINFMQSNDYVDVQLRNSNRDCLRVYEGIELDLRKTRFNITDLDLNYTPKLKICSQNDLTHRSLNYASRGQAIYVLISGNATAKFRIHPFSHYCGGEFRLDKGEFASPNYPDSMPNSDLDCFYHLSGSPGSKIALTLKNLRFPRNAQSAIIGSSSDVAAAATSNSQCDDVSHIEIYKLDQMQKRLQDKELRSFSNNNNNGKQNNNNANNRTTKSKHRLNDLASLYSIYMQPTTNGYIFNRPNQQVNLFDYHNAKLMGKFCDFNQPMGGSKRLQFNIDGDVLIRYRHFKDTIATNRLAQSSMYTNAGLTSNNILRQQFQTDQDSMGIGFLASYSIQYGGSIEISPGSANSIGIIGSPQFPTKQRLNETILWTLHSDDPDSVLQFELISLDLTSGSNGINCLDSLDIFDGPNPTKDIQLVKLCGSLMFKRTHFSSSTQSTNSAAFDARANDPITEKNLIRLIQTSSNFASIVYDNNQVKGQFLLRYSTIKKKIDSKTNKTLANNGDYLDNQLDNDLLSVDDALKQQGLIGSKNVSSLCSKTIELNSLNVNGTMQEISLRSPNWPNEPQQTSIECHWLIMTHETKTIRFHADLIEFSDSGSSEPIDSSNRSPEYCFDQAYADTKRAYLIIHDGASFVSPELARYCLPMIPNQLQSTGRYMLVRYIYQRGHQTAPKIVGQTSDVDNGETSPGLFVETRPRRFKGRVSLSRCGGQYHIKTMLLLDDDSANRAGNLNYENNLDCTYFLFAESLSHSLGLHWQRFDLSSEPSNFDCTIGDYIEIKMLNFGTGSENLAMNSNDQQPMLESLGYSVGRSLGRFCQANKPNLKSTDYYGAGLVLEFHSDSSNSAAGWSLVAVSYDPEDACSKHLELNADSQGSGSFARFISPSWPHGFYGERDCHYLFTTQPQKTMEISFLRIRRARESDWTTLGGASANCKDSMQFLDDNEASTGTLTLFKKLFKDRNTVTFKTEYGKRLSKLVQAIPCENHKSRRQGNGPRPLTSTDNLIELANIYNMTSLMDYIDMDIYYELKRMFNSQAISQMVYTTNSSAFMFNYRSANLLPGEGFLALVKVNDKQVFKCGGKITLNDNSIISSQFNIPIEQQATNSSNLLLQNNKNLYEQCVWKLPQLVSGWPNTEGNYLNLLFDRFEEASLTSSDYATTASSFKTSYIIFDVLEIPPAIEGTVAFESRGFGLYDKVANEHIDRTCSLNRLIVRSRLDLPTVACGNLTGGLSVKHKQQRWMPIKTLDTELVLRTRNELTNDKDNNNFYRGLRAFYHESQCRSLERVAGAAIRIQAKLSENSSYVPSICWWRLDLNSDDFEIWFKKINFRKPILGPENDNQTKQQQQQSQIQNNYMLCDPNKYLDLDYLELRAQESSDSAILQRFCYFNQEISRMKQIILSNSDKTLHIQFVSGYERLSNNLKSFPELPDKNNNNSKQVDLYDFDLLITALSNNGDFCKLTMDFNFNTMIVHQENSNENIWLGHDLMSIKMYPKSVHCTQYISLINPDSRINISFYGIFDIESSPYCANDYLLIENVFPQVDKTINIDDNQIEQKKSTTNTNNSTSIIGRWCGRKRPEGNFISSSNKVKITFHSNEKIEGRGFRLLWKESKKNKENNEEVETIDTKI